MSTTPHVALTIAGSDSGGGAGIAADVKTFFAHGVFATIAITAVTAQNSEKVHELCALEPSLVTAQMRAVLEDFPVAATKTGMLANVGIVEAVVALAAEGALPNLVVDPVLVSSSGSLLLEGDARAAYAMLLPHALVATPNIPEAEVLLGRSIDNESDMADAARALVDAGCRIAVVKGGHLQSDLATDIVFDGSAITRLCEPMVKTRNVHGTGCTFAAAITANLAIGRSPVEAIAHAKDYVSAAIKSASSWRLGGGHGPIDHTQPAN